MQVNILVIIGKKWPSNRRKGHKDGSMRVNGMVLQLILSGQEADYKKLRTMSLELRSGSCRSLSDPSAPQENNRAELSTWM